MSFVLHQYIIQKHIVLWNEKIRTHTLIHPSDYKFKADPETDQKILWMPMHMRQCILLNLPENSCFQVIGT